MIDETACQCEREPAWCFVHRRWGRAMSSPPTRAELVEQVRGERDALRDAARAYLDALEAPAPVWDADESEHDGHAARLEVARVALRALVGGAS